MFRHVSSCFIQSVMESNSPLLRGKSGARHLSQASLRCTGQRLHSDGRSSAHIDHKSYCQSVSPTVYICPSVTQLRYNIGIKHAERCAKMWKTSFIECSEFRREWQCPAMVASPIPKTREALQPLLQPMWQLRLQEAVP